ncbi:hypothetical protein [Marinactinospora rubrisoli]|uniref:Uncharacterized protein n=1 Tax=Marinactinospora rubrisoli TaxID=2715399 RepID=A0ABW2KB42_9ACTN
MGRHEKPSRQPQENAPATEGDGGGGTASHDQEPAAPPENAGGTHLST